MTWIYRVLAAGRVEVFVDASQDKYAAHRGWSRLDCTALNIDESTLEFGPGSSCVETPLPTDGPRP